MEEIIDGLPVYLYQSTSDIVGPPVESLKQTLPFQELQWKNFERLCCRLIAELADIKFSYLYGTSGQAQYGIDIYAKRFKQEKFSVYQCKNVEEFSGTKLKKAVDKFLNNKWKNTTSEFTFCIAAEYNKTEQLDIFEEQRNRLHTEGIKLNKWDVVELSRILKNKPNLVDDFFGRQWVKSFCGEDAFQSLNKSTKLSAEQVVVRYKRTLKLFYSIVFNQSDITSIATNAKLDFIEKYVVPDVVSYNTVTVENEKPLEKKPELQRLYRAGVFFDIEYLEIADKKLPLYYEEEHFSYNKLQLKDGMPIDESVSLYNKSIILGEPGIGKSSFLKFLTLDILSENPVLNGCVKNWGDYLPL